MIDLRGKHAAETDDEASAETELVDRGISADAHTGAVIADKKGTAGVIDGRKELRL